jgi:aryl-alcohol dehydrogenase-like predicted oxidoreductase
MLCSLFRIQVCLRRLAPYTDRGRAALAPASANLHEPCRTPPRGAGPRVLLRFEKQPAQEGEAVMEQRQLGGCGLRVPVLGFGTATFGGVGEVFKAWGGTEVEEARRLVDICLEAGVTFFDTANAYSRGRAEEVLGAALAGRRSRVLLSTKANFPMGEGPNDSGSSRYSLLRACEDSLRRLGTDYIDIYYIHGFDATTPVEETLSTLDTLVRSGKVRYIGCSNFSGWHLMKSLSVSERYGWARYVTQQVYYSLVSRELEWELMPLALDQKVGTVVWSALAGGALSGKLRRGKALPEGSRLSTADFPPVRSERLYDVIDVLEALSAETGKTMAQIALNWVLQRPTVTTVIIGARDEKQLRQNLGATGWALTAEQMARLDAASETQPIYPYWHQRGFPALNPPPVPVYPTKR